MATQACSDAPRVLVVDDEAMLADLLSQALRHEGWETATAKDGLDALAKATSFHPDVVILDVQMPRMDGLETLERLRARDPELPVLFLTARDAVADRVQGLRAGADDYVTKPFSPSELVARVDAVYRRVAQFTRAAEPNFSEELRSGRFVLNLRNRSFTKDGNPVELTQVEFQIMEYFISNAGKALKRSEILKHVWGSGYVGEEKIVDVNIRRLRMKIEDEPSNPRHVVTVWGIGYRWDK